MKTKPTSPSVPAHRSLGERGFFVPRVLIGFAFCSAGLLLALAGFSQSVTGTIAMKAPAQTLGAWIPTASMPTARYLHTAALLPNGQALVAGGYNGDYLTSAELYDPATGLWTATGSMAAASVLTFSEAITSVDSRATSCGRVESVTINGSEVIVNLVGVTCNGSDVTGVNGGSGSLAEASVTFGLLVGDVDGDGRVTTADVNLVRANIGRQPPTSDNFREDVTVNGKINHGDINVVRSKKGNRFGD